ncbi:MAG: hypothetical protein WCT07_04515 [Candidatus Paceibacterota bacterium]
MTTKCEIISDVLEKYVNTHEYKPEKFSVLSIPMLYQTIGLVDAQKSLPDELKLKMRTELNQELEKAKELVQQEYGSDAPTDFTWDDFLKCKWKNGTDITRHDLEKLELYNAPVPFLDVEFLNGVFSSKIRNLIPLSWDRFASPDLIIFLVIFIVLVIILSIIGYNCFKHNEPTVLMNLN